MTDSYDPQRWKTALEQKLMVMRLIFGSILMSLIILIGMVMFLNLNPAEPNEDLHKILRMVFSLACIGLILGQQVAGMALASVERLKKAAKKNERAPLEALQQTFIVRWAMLETVAMLGFVIFVLTGHTDTALTFIVLSFIALLASFPRKGALEEKLKEVFRRT